MLSHVRLFVTPWTTACQAPLSLTISWSLLKLMSIELVILSNHLILCHPLLFPSIRVISNELVLHIRWPNYWRFSFSISPSNEHPGLISFKVDCCPLTCCPRTPKSLLQHCSSEVSIFWHSAFFMVPLSHLYRNPGKTVALTIWVFVGKVMSLLFDRLSRFVVIFFPRSKHLLISWLQSPSAVILEPKNIISVRCFQNFPFYLPWNCGIRCHDFRFLNVEF